jgi:predicted nucleic acid-binding protein
MPVIDASVLVARFHSGDKFHEKSVGIFENLIEGGKVLRVPSLAFIEVAAAVRRQTKSTPLANAVLRALKNLKMEVWDLDDVLTRSAERIAATTGMRGADAVYVAVAMECGDSIVTLDAEQKKRATEFVDVL